MCGLLDDNQKSPERSVGSHTGRFPLLHSLSQNNMEAYSDLLRKARMAMLVVSDGTAVTGLKRAKVHTYVISLSGERILAMVKIRKS